MKMNFRRSLARDDSFFSPRCSIGCRFAGFYAIFVVFFIAFFFTFFKDYWCNSFSVITPKKFIMRARENKSQISQDYILHVKFSGFYLCFHNSCEIWHLFSRAPMRNRLWCYYRQLIISIALEKCIKECDVLSTETWNYSIFWWIPS